jgi:hypothetical protein
MHACIHTLHRTPSKRPRALNLKTGAARTECPLRSRSWTFQGICKDIFSVHVWSCIRIHIFIHEGIQSTAHIHMLLLCVVTKRTRGGLNVRVVGGLNVRVVGGLNVRVVGGLNVRVVGGLSVCMFGSLNIHACTSLNVCVPRKFEKTCIHSSYHT